MEQRKTALIGTPLLVIMLIVVGIGVVRSHTTPAIQNGDPDNEMTISVARIAINGNVISDSGGQKYNDYELCTGSVVGDKWILTARHCFPPSFWAGSKQNNWKTISVELWKAGMGISPEYSLPLSEPPYYYPDALDDGAETGDVMLLHVSYMPDWAKTIPTAFEWPVLNTALTEYGYGNLGPLLSPPQPTPTPSQHLMKTKPGSIIRAGCPTHSGYPWTNGHICTSVSLSLPWEGDSGGPLVWWNHNAWQQVGTFSLHPRLSGKLKDPDQGWRSYWSEVDPATHNWLLATIGANFPMHSILQVSPNGGPSWLWGEGGYRHWISDAATYNCLKQQGWTPITSSLRTIEALPDFAGSNATCIQPTPAPVVQATPTSQPVQAATPTSQPQHPPVQGPTPTPVPYQPPPATLTPQPAPHPVDAYSNYGSTTDGRAMCRGNPNTSQSLPGGTVSQTFTVPGGVSTLSSALIQIDPASTVTAHLSIAVNGNVMTTADATPVGDTHFTFGQIAVNAGDTITLRVQFSATYGTIVTVYGAGNPGGTFAASNSCPAGGANFSQTNTGLRAVVSGMS